MENEVGVYHFLGHEAGAGGAQVQGEVVPKFLMRGPDVGFIWAVATSYEGVSLETLQSQAEAKGEELAGEIQERALGALAALHRCGVLHAQVELRHAVWREKDGAVLWVDLAESRIRGRDFVGREAEFVWEAEREMSGLRGLLGGAVGGVGVVVGGFGWDGGGGKARKGKEEKETETEEDATAILDASTTSASSSGSSSVVSAVVAEVASVAVAC